jgi:monovalent cation:H+ antiporter-2, CPA2 family
MAHGNLNLITILTVGFALSSIFGCLATRFRLPSILGFILAGYVVGPFSPGYVADLAISEQLAELGVTLMLFSVGLHFELDDLLKVKKIAIPGAIVQTLSTTLLTALAAYFLDWPLHVGIILGFAIGVASTAMMVRVLTDNQLVNTQAGHIAIGWLIVEDIFTVFLLVLLPLFPLFLTAGPTNLSHVVSVAGVLVLKFCVLGLIIFTFGKRVVDAILERVVKYHSKELLGLTVLALIFAIALGSTWFFGTSIALGAFISGMLLAKTKARKKAISHAFHLKNIFSVFFFLSIGMLFDPSTITKHVYAFLGILAVVIIIKPVVAHLFMMFKGYPKKTSLIVALSLAQIGEFSFILAEEAMGLNLVSDEIFDLLVAVAVTSISINPLLFHLLDKRLPLHEASPIIKGKQHDAIQNRK